MRNNEGMHHEEFKGFFEPTLHTEIDDTTFVQWKSELQKNLTSFWSSMNKKKKYF